MPTPRRRVVDPCQAGFYHCHSRCVRRAFLCGDGLDHRRDWIRDRLQELAALFAIDVCGYAVMSNHLHAVLWTEPARARSWSRQQVARRWISLFPGALAAHSTPGVIEQAVWQLAADVQRIEVLRGRLSDLSWFMRCLCEPIARQANREDDCSGRFWEGRFRCRRLLDEAALLTCMVYVDLNVIRAKLAATPEESDHTSVHDRIAVRQCIRRCRGTSRTVPERVTSLLPHLDRGRVPKHEEDGIWLAPIQDRADHRKRSRRRRSLLQMTLDQYLTLVDSVGRVVRGAGTGAIPTSLHPILDRLDLDLQAWLKFIRDPGPMIGTAIGSAANLASEAARRGARWVVGTLPIYRSCTAD